MVRFQRSDSWVLLSVVHAGGTRGADLESLISVGDYINHSIFDYEELRGGLSRLLRAGLILQKPGGWAASSAARKAASVRGRGFAKQFAALEALLEKARPASPVALRGVTRPSFEQAYRRYADRPF